MNKNVQEKILKEIEELINKINNETNEIIIKRLYLDLNYLITLYNDCYSNDTLDIDFEGKINPDEIMTNFNNEIIINDFKNFDQNKELIKDITYNALKQINKLKVNNYKMTFNKYSINDAYNIIKAFFHEFDPTLDEYINNMLNENKTLYYQKENSRKLGSNYYIYSDKNSYISINGYENHLIYMHLTAIVHELAHSIYDYYNADKLSNDEFSINRLNINNEIISLTMERLFIEYCLKNNIDINNTNYLCNYKLSNIYESFIGINLAANLKKINIDNDGNNQEEDEDVKQVCQKLKKQFGVKIDYNNFNFDLFNHYRYSIGDYIGLNFGEMYKKDSEYMKYNYNNLMNDMGKVNDYDIFNNYGFNEEELVKNKVLIKEIKRLNNN